MDIAPLTIAWGWEGMLGAAGFLLVALTGVAALFLLEDGAPRRPTLRGLARRWQAPVALVLTLCFVVAAIDAVWGATHVRVTQVTVAGRDTEVQDGGETIYYVDDAAGRRYTVTHTIYRRVRTGERLECEETVPLIRKRALLSCERRTAR